MVYCEGKCIQVQRTVIFVASQPRRAHQVQRTEILIFPGKTQTNPISRCAAPCVSCRSVVLQIFRGAAAGRYVRTAVRANGFRERECLHGRLGIYPISRQANSSNPGWVRNSLRKSYLEIKRDANASVLRLPVRNHMIFGG